MACCMGLRALTNFYFYIINFLPFLIFMGIQAQAASRSPGQPITINGQTYTFDRELATTVFNRVCLALDSDGQKVVIKISNHPGDPFAMESYNLSSLYPHVLQQARLPRMRYRDLRYAVLDYVEGSSLVDHLATITLSQIRSLVRSLAPHVDTLRSHDMAHRDIKPLNIILENSSSDFRPDTIRLIDYDLLVRVDDVSRCSPTAQGTPFYIPPEYCSGNLHRNNDVYALGMVGLVLLPPSCSSSIYQNPEVIRGSFSDYRIMSSKVNGRFFLPDARKKLEESLVSQVIDCERRGLRALLDFLFSCVKDSPQDRPATLHEMWQMLDGTGNITEL